MNKKLKEIRYGMDKYRVFHVNEVTFGQGGGGISEATDIVLGSNGHMINSGWRKPALAYESFLRHDVSTVALYEK